MWGVCFRNVSVTKAIDLNSRNRKGYFNRAIEYLGGSLNFHAEGICLRNVETRPVQPFSLLCDRTTTIQPAKVRGQLFDLLMGYPGMVAGKGWVKGYLLSFTDEAVLADLDRLEDYQRDRPSHDNEYQREWVEVFDEDERSQGFAWAYFMSVENVERYGGTWIANGEWRSA